MTNHWAFVISHCASSLVIRESTFVIRHSLESVFLLESHFMLAKRIIPCLDVDRGRVVKGVNFVELIDAGDPVECGKRYDQAGADELVFLDITASSDARNIVANYGAASGRHGIHSLYCGRRHPQR